jgi:hypothetical protein
MRKLKDTLIVLFLLTIVVLAVTTVWREGFRVEEENGIAPEREEIMERKLDNWVPKMP